MEVRRRKRRNPLQENVPPASITNICGVAGYGIQSATMLLIIAILLVLFWVGGFAFHVAGGLIHIILVVAVILFILHFVRGRGV